MTKLRLPSPQVFLKRAVITISIAILLAGLCFWGYSEFASYSAEPVALNTALADKNVEIQEKNAYFEIKPKDLNPEAKSIIFYPGGLVRPQSYLAKMVKISKLTKSKVFLIKSPLNLAFFDIGAADKIIAENNLTQPILAGHSLGGVAACRYLRDNQQNISGIYLYGSYCDQSITGFKGSVLVVFGQNDQVLNHQELDKNKINLPDQAVFREIPGLNHSGIGNYGLQKGDGDSNLSTDEVVKNMLF